MKRPTPKVRSYSASTLELRAARRRFAGNQSELAKRAKVKMWEVANALTDGFVALEKLNKVRGFLKLPALDELPRHVLKRKALDVETKRPAATPEEAESLPVCDWERVATAAGELSTAAADYQFAESLLTEATFRLKAAQRAALVAGLAVAPALTGSGGRSLEASKNTTRFFKMLSVGGALPL